MNHAISISSAAEFAQIGLSPDYPLNGNYILTQDITLDTSWITIGDSAAPFTGTLNGQCHTISLLWDYTTNGTNDVETTAIFYQTSQAYICNMVISATITSTNIGTTLTYVALDTVFKNITITGTFSKVTGLMSGLVLISTGCYYENINSSLNLTYTALDFSVENIAGGIVNQLTTRDGYTVAQWNGSNYANIFISCTYNATITANLSTASYSADNPFYIGGIFGSTRLASPPVYYGIYLKNCFVNARYNITGTLNTSVVTQYNYIDQFGTTQVSYDPNDIAVSSKTEREIVEYGQVAQNIAITSVIADIIKKSYGYYGPTLTSINDGSPVWNYICSGGFSSISTQSGQCTGQITGLAPFESYEIRSASDETYTPIFPGSTCIGGLAEGNYYVRVRSIENVAIPTEVEICATAHRFNDTRSKS